MPTTQLPLTTWNRDRGTRQSRIVPSGYTPPNGTHVLCLGYDRPGLSGFLAIGDYDERSQRLMLDNVNILRVKLHMRSSSAFVGGTAWKFSILIDGSERSSRILVAGRTRDLIDVGVNTSKDVGTHVVTYRLTLVAG